MRDLPLLFTHPPLAKAAADDLAAALHALADPARLQLLSLLATFPDREARGIDLVRALDRLHQTTVSHHLGLLEEAGLIACRRQGPYVFNRLAPAALCLVLAALRPDGHHG